METTNNKTALLDGGITQATFDKWKAEYGTIHKVKVVIKKADKGKPGDIAYGYVRDINEDMDLMCNILSLQASNSILEAKILLLDNAWLGGDTRIMSVTSVKIAACTIAAKTVDILGGSVEKL